MKSFARRKALAALAFTVFLSSGALGLTASRLREQAPTPEPQRCSAPEYRQFDFWLGDWDVFDVATGAKDSRVRVASILDGCAVHEDYQSVDGHRAESFSIYDASRRVWHQTWVTNRGRLLVIEGQLENGSMILSGSDRTATGEQRRVRGIWKRVEGGVREAAFISLDSGKTWQPWFDLLFRPHK